MWEKESSNHFEMLLWLCCEKMDCCGGACCNGWQFGDERERVVMREKRKRQTREGDCWVHLLRVWGVPCLRRNISYFAQNSPFCAQLCENIIFLNIIYFNGKVCFYFSNLKLQKRHTKHVVFDFPMSWGWLNIISHLLKCNLNF